MCRPYGSKVPMYDASSRRDCERQVSNPPIIRGGLLSLDEGPVIPWRQNHCICRFRRFSTNRERRLFRGGDPRLFGGAGSRLARVACVVRYVLRMAGRFSCGDRIRRAQTCHRHAMRIPLPLCRDAAGPAGKEGESTPACTGGAQLKGSRAIQQIQPFFPSGSRMPAGVPPSFQKIAVRDRVSHFIMHSSLPLQFLSRGYLSRRYLSRRYNG
jgi:hypothetical protein